MLIIGVDPSAYCFPTKPTTSRWYNGLGPRNAQMWQSMAIFITWTINGDIMKIKLNMMEVVDPKCTTKFFSLSHETTPFWSWNSLFSHTCSPQTDNANPRPLHCHLTGHIEAHLEANHQHPAGYWMIPAATKWSTQNVVCKHKWLEKPLPNHVFHMSLVPKSPFLKILSSSVISYIMNNMHIISWMYIPFARPASQPPRRSAAAPGGRHPSSGHWPVPGESGGSQRYLGKIHGNNQS
jgi:hypothetical protein